MVDMSVDPGAATGKIMRETQEAAAASAAAREQSARAEYLEHDATYADPAEASARAAAAGAPGWASAAVAAESVPPAPPPLSQDADAAFRKARLGVSAAVVLVLLLAWISQRRSRAAARGAGEEASR